MRRSGFLRVSSAQSVCLFCACRIAGASSNIPPSTFSRHISDSRRANQDISDRSVSSSSPFNSSSIPEGFVFDPTSKLSRSEQLQRASIRAARQEQERSQREILENRRIQLEKAEEQRKLETTDGNHARFSAVRRENGSAQNSMLGGARGADPSRPTVTVKKRWPRDRQNPAQAWQEQEDSSRGPAQFSPVRRLKLHGHTSRHLAETSTNAHEVWNARTPSPSFEAVVRGDRPSGLGSGDLQRHPSSHGTSRDGPFDAQIQPATQENLQKTLSHTNPSVRLSSSPTYPWSTARAPDHAKNVQLNVGDRGGTYQTRPFNPNEMPDSTFDANRDEQWTHLRPKTPGQLPNAPVGASSIPSTETDLSWIDASFEKHRAARPRYAPAPISPPNYERYAQTVGRGSRSGMTTEPCARCGGEGHTARSCSAKFGEVTPSYTSGNASRPHPQPRSPLMINKNISQNSNLNERAKFRPISAVPDQPDQRWTEPAVTNVSETHGVVVRKETEHVSSAQERRRRKFAIEEEDESASVRSHRDGHGRKRGRNTRAHEENEGVDFDEDFLDPALVRDREAKKAARKAQKEQDKAERTERAAQKKAKADAAKRKEGIAINIPDYVTVATLAQLLNVRYERFVERLEELGYDDVFPGKALNFDTSSLIAMEYGFNPSNSAENGSGSDLVAQPELVDKSALPVRPSVVTIMGHVDHGKTTILDYLRKSSIVAGEAGGITQHIGAFSVPLASSGKTITFLDTPGHAAFLAMRQRGANVTDIVVLVVAADDSVKPQTLEAIKHAKNAGVPMIVAVNKIDKDQANIRRVKDDLARHGVEIEDFGGETQVVPVSGKTGQGMDELEESIVTLSEILDHRAEVDGLIEGRVLEASTKKSGKVATVLIRRGTITPGTIIVAGTTWARVRTLHNEGGQSLESVGPGMPVEVDGWRDQPVAGDEVLEAPTEQKACDVVEYRSDEADRLKIAADMEAINEARRQHHDRKDESHEELSETKAEPEQTGPTTVPFIIKADVSGSAEAVSAYIQSISSPFVTPLILEAAVGPVHESDVERADASRGHIIAFNVPHDEGMKTRAESLGVRILENNIIYRVLDDVKAVLEEKVPPIISQRVLGEAEVGAVFDIGIGGRKTMRIAGCKVRNGVIGKGSQVRVMRGEEKVYDGIISSLKNVKKDVQEMRKGTECGMGFDGWEQFETDDVIQTYETISEKRRL